MGEEYGPKDSYSFGAYGPDLLLLPLLHPYGETYGGWEEGTVGPVGTVGRVGTVGPYGSVRKGKASQSFIRFVKC